ncbi:hypothetical protein HF313_06055 [Massilia atriviolacea]|uniref:Uncharacterized protein n=1 Tax=Massilia atriviolacea TaxID=2495579 RepID=A0A430HC37_9BURK|nr:hypothetical protein [Massilia atriviolacea]RSZ55096.1 hypothetical protein EJB06_31255 [Massilia atriviolacea]
MDGIRRFYAILLADLLERVRSTRFRAAMALALGLTWSCFPAIDAGYMILGINGQYRGAFSSAWVGMVLAMLSIWVSLLGFYVVRGTISRDLDTRVWELLETTPLRRAVYLLAKWASHMAVFGLIIGAQLLVGLLAQWVRGEDRSIDLVELLKPVLLLSIPSLALTAMFAIWFDIVPWLRRTAGNIAYFAVWVAVLIATVTTLNGTDLAAGERSALGDPRGIIAFNQSIHEQVAPQLGGARLSVCLGCGMGDKQVRTVEWRNWRIGGADIVGRFAWLGLAIVGVLLCHPFMDRAAAHARATERHSAALAGGRSIAWLGLLLRPLQRSQSGTILAAELQLTLRQRSLWWWLGLAVAGAVQLLAPPQIAALAVIAAWGLSLDVFARCALREVDSGTAPVVFGAAHAGRRILLARWLMLAGVALASVLPALLRFTVADAAVALAIVALALSVATWALALAALTRSAHAFELAACILAYLGITGAPVFHAVAAPAATMQMHLLALPLGLALLGAGWARLHSATPWAAMLPFPAKK